VVELGREAAQTITCSKKMMTAFAGAASYPTLGAGLSRKISRDLSAKKNLAPKVIHPPSDLSDNADVLTEGGPQRRPRTQDVRAVVGVDFDRVRTGGMRVPSKPLTSKLVRLERGPAAKTLQTRIWLGGETNG